MGNSQETWNYIKKGIDSYLKLIQAELTMLQLSKKAAEQCEEAQRNFSFEIGAEAPKQLVCADESAVNILTSYQENGWAYKGLTAQKRACFVRGMW
jgi:hypothetical protein